MNTVPPGTVEDCLAACLIQPRSPEPNVDACPATGQLGGCDLSLRNTIDLNANTVLVASMTFYS